MEWSPAAIEADIRYREQHLARLASANQRMGKPSGDSTALRTIRSALRRWRTKRTERTERAARGRVRVAGHRSGW
ncbi:MAG: hypothetical protein ACRDRL_24710 [Sciscionella sp.]